MSDHDGADHNGANYDGAGHDGATAETPIAQWLRSLAAAAPSPGGGAAAALLSGIAAALTEMAAGYTLDSASPVRGSRIQDRLELATAVRAAAPALADNDAAVSAGFSLAYDTPEGSSEREAHVHAASIAAAQSAVALGHHAASLVPLIRELASNATAMIRADIAVAACMLAASVRASAINATVDLRLAGTAARAHPELMDEPAALDVVAEELETIAEQVRTGLDPG